MQLGMVGLGRMGRNMAIRLLRAGHEVIGYDPGSPDADLERQGVILVPSLSALVERLTPARLVWLMVPAGKAVQESLDRLAELLAAGDLVVDGGNSFYQDTLRRRRELAARGIHLVDVGTSGGVWGLEEGYSLMVGGEEGEVRRLKPILQALAPGPELGWGHVGPPGSGHFVKMVHNGVEYGLMQAYAEGFALLAAKEDFRLDLHQVAQIWRYGSVVRSWLLDLVARALRENPQLEGIAPYVEDSGEGRWTVLEALRQEVPAPVITLALLARLRSRQENAFADRLLAALRHQFGGHPLRKEPRQ